MKMQTACGLAVSLAGSLLVGCSTNQGIVRGQNPEQAQVVGRASVELAGFHGNHHVINRNHRFREDPGACQGPDCPYLHDSGHTSGRIRHGSHGRQTWHPTHRHWFKYQQPHDLVYPPANTPAPIVQYPYYNLKGPADFFMK